MTIVEEYLKKHGLGTENELTGEVAVHYYYKMLRLVKLKDKLSEEKFRLEMKNAFYQISGWFRVVDWEKCVKRKKYSSELYQLLFDLVVFISSPNTEKSGRWFSLDEERLEKNELVYEDEEFLSLLSEEERFKSLFLDSAKKQMVIEDCILKTAKESIEHMEIEEVVEPGLLKVLEQYVIQEEENLHKIFKKND